MSSKPLFHTVTTYNRGLEAFELVGIFSKPEEAEAFALPYRESKEHEGVGVVNGPVSMPIILSVLTRERLGGVAAALEKIGVKLGEPPG